MMMMLSILLGIAGAVAGIVLQHDTGDGGENSLRGAEAEVAGGDLRQRGRSHRRHVEAGRRARVFPRNRRHSLPRGPLLCRWHGPLRRIQEGTPPNPNRWRDNSSPISASAPD